MKGLVSASPVLLGVQHVEAPDYPDGAHQHYRSSLSAAITWRSYGTVPTRS